MAQAPPKINRYQFHAASQPERLQRVKTILHEHTPLATVLQEVVVEFLKGATLFVADYSKCVILAVDFENNNKVRVFAGKSGEKGHADGRGSCARLTQPEALAVDPASGDLLVCDGTCIRRITPDRRVSTLCGDWTKSGCREGVGYNALFCSFGGCAVIGKDLFVCDSMYHCIRRVPLDGSSTSLFAGSPDQRGCVNGVGAEAKFAQPEGICSDGENNVIVADCMNCSIRKITPAGVVTTLAGSGDDGAVNGAAEKASFRYPETVVYDAECNRVLVADGNRAIRSIDLETHQVSKLMKPKERAHSLAVDGADLYVALRKGVYRADEGGCLGPFLVEADLVDSLWGRGSKFSLAVRKA